jgi:hypothetical protein
MNSPAYSVGYPKINLIRLVGNKNSRVNSRVFVFFRIAGMRIIMPVYTTLKAGSEMHSIRWLFLSIYKKKNSVISD